MPTTTEIWVIDDDQSIRWVLDKALTKAKIPARLFETAEEALQALEADQPQVILTDISMPGMTGIELLAELKQRYPDIPIVIMTAYSDLDSAVSAYEGGAFEYLPKPFDINEAIDIIQRASESASQKVSTAAAANDLSKLPKIIGEAPAMQEVFRAIGRLAHSNITVLINGESGTGKELVAQALHRHSPRTAQPFIALNMAAIPKDLMESELFGHEKGAFTGANSKREGRFEQADGGTLFLDEIGDMPAETQTRLLRVLADGEFYRVGGHASVKVDVRIIAATHQDLEELVQQGDFREDLFHRLNVIRIHIPKLAERREDIPRLMQYFFQQAAEELGGETKILLPEAEAFLVSLEWPGNVRQLENTCRWITVMASGREVHLSDLPPELGKSTASPPDSGQADWRELLYRWARNELVQGKHHILQDATPAFEKVMIEVALQHSQGRKRDAAELLGWGRNTLTRKIKDLELEL